MVETDAKWLRFILQQLLSNAIKYSAGSKGKVTVSAFTGENGRSYKESTGMGLYLVKEIAEQLNHEIRLESEVGRGTSVQIVFPNALN